MTRNIQVFFISIVCFALVSSCIQNETNLEEKKQMKNKIVVITGISKGLGKALIQEFAQHNWHVAGCASNADAIKAMQTEYGSDHFFSAVDISDYEAVKKWAQEVITKIGSPDMLINNAGIINQQAPLWQISPQEFSKLIDINVKGVFNVIHSFIPSMITKGKGTIINISSSWGRKGEAKFAPYSASKFAVEGLTQALAQELPLGLIAVSLDPGGGINTDMLKKCYPEGAKDYPSAQSWAQKAFPFILNINARDNGKALTIPSIR